ncbi:hypothetical protein B0T24DRAFT_678991 [Lasiosphaeria ovina]|uniref:25S rRNA (Uridine(2843)-N(3))-methyltransferase n=1 Tax=Lasiosphaeria ovina TaxID=92902 RepID=A0AAE0KBA9_9PEZI|nr:hypothetical protein B0T24DRAFT_678991 [Lasiosphaeria ovina]
MVSNTKGTPSMKRINNKLKTKNKNKIIRNRNLKSTSQADAAALQRRQQQHVLDVFRAAFGDVLSSSAFAASVQAVKQALFARDFAAAFGIGSHDREASNRLLAVYAARWSPTRALCYAAVLRGIYDQGHLDPLLRTPSSSTAAARRKQQHDVKANELPEGEQQREQQPDPASAVPIRQPVEKRQLRVLGIGGGAAEMVAFGSFLNQVSSFSSDDNDASEGDEDEDEDEDEDYSSGLAGDITLVDAAAWGGVVSTLQTGITTPEPSTPKEPPMVPPAYLSSRFSQNDVLALGHDGLAALMPLPHSSSSSPPPVLVTLLFTLNELFTSSGVGKTTAFLLDLTSAVPVGSLLLVVDSPGSYSETAIGGSSSNTNPSPSTAAAPAAPPAKRHYPMQWLLDRILLGTQKESVGGRAWRKLEAHDSVWFRLGTSSSSSSGGGGGGGGGLDYPIPLENMRYQMHLYRAEDASSTAAAALPKD